MNDRNAFLQGQGSPIKDDAPPPEQGWRGERAATEPNDDTQHRTLPGSGIEVEEVSGTAFAEARLPDDPQEASSRQGQAPTGQTPQQGMGARQGDGVNDLQGGKSSPGGESSGDAYPQPYKQDKGHKDQGGLMSHGGQSEIAYHGSGHLGEQTVDDDDNRNGVAEKDD